MNWQVISFFTSGTSYEQEIKNLEISLLKMGFPYKFYSYAPTGTWRGNLNYKSQTILRAFDDFPDRDIVFLDADAVVRRYPDLFDILSHDHTYDIAACFFKYRPESGDSDELLSGTLWVQNGDGGRKIVEAWHRMGLSHPEKRHQMCLKAVIAALEASGDGVRIYRLPFEYTCIFDYGAARGKTPVIEHFQASRRFRKEVGFGTSLIPGRPRFRGSLSTRDVIRMRNIQRARERRIRA